MKEDSSLMAEAARLAKEVQELNQRIAQAAQGGGMVNTDAAHAKERDVSQHTRSIRPPLPDPRLVRRIIRHRQQRAIYFDPQLFADPAWDMLLDLTAARAEHRRVSVTSLCIASGVPPTTALRWIGQMVEQGHFMRVGDQTDRRRAFIELSEPASNAMAQYFDVTGTGAHR